MRTGHLLKWMLLIVIGVSLILVSGSLRAQGNQPGAMKQRCMDRFKSMDKNDDGKLTFDEFNSVSHPRGDPQHIFNARDLNGDGYLNPEELCTHWRK